MDKDDAQCSKLVEEFNDRTSGQKVYPAQVAGYWSFLCRMVLKGDEDLKKWFQNAVKKGVITAGDPMPYATDAFKSLIIKNMEEQKAQAAHRAAYKSHMQKAPSETKPSTIGF